MLIDTCVLSEIQHPRGDAGVKAKFAALPNEQIHISVITIGELAKGIARLEPGARRRGLRDWLDAVVTAAGPRLLSVDLDAARGWGEITARAAAAGRTVPPADGLIAATALTHGLRVMTRNVADFEPTGVLTVNPWEG